jgi:hypothetical protein
MHHPEIHHPDQGQAEWVSGCGPTTGCDAPAPMEVAGPSGLARDSPTARLSRNGSDPALRTNSAGNDLAGAAARHPNEREFPVLQRLGPATPTDLHFAQQATPPNAPQPPSVYQPLTGSNEGRAHFGADVRHPNPAKRLASAAAGLATACGTAEQGQHWTTNQPYERPAFRRHLAKRRS